MPIPATPSVVSATYDLWAIGGLRQVGVGLASAGESAAPPVGLVATLAKYRLRDDGVPEMSPMPADQVAITIPDLYALAATDPKVATALAALVEAVVSVARDQGKL
jgi:hypothetical protein